MAKNQKGTIGSWGLGRCKGGNLRQSTERTSKFNNEGVQHEGNHWTEDLPAEWEQGKHLDVRNSPAHENLIGGSTSCRTVELRRGSYFGPW